MKKIIIAGAGASGKDFFAEFLEKRGFTKAKDYTTRPKRNSNLNDYMYVDIIDNNDCYYTFHVRGNNWIYAYSKEQTKLKDFSIRPPESILPTIEFLKDNGYETYLVYFDIDFNIRKERLSKRSDFDIERRLKTDNVDFASFMIKYKPDLVVNDPNFDPDKLLNEIIKSL
jgi:dephospho-CoA kinase